MSGRMVKRLSQLDIDEVSLVDRPANQHGLVAIAKNDSQEDPMDPELYDIEGNPIDPETLEDGAQVFVFDEEGTAHEMVYFEGDAPEGFDGFEDEGAPQEERELASVGKALRVPRHAGGPAFGGRMAEAAQRGNAAGVRARQATNQFAGQAAGHVSRNRVAYGAGAGGAVAGYGAGKVGKSFGAQVLEELSKAYGNDERDQIISKALTQVDEIAKRNQALEEFVLEMAERQEYGDFEELAKSYDGLAIGDDDLAGVLQRAAHSLDPEDLAVIDRVLSGASNVSKQLFEELGYGGQGESDILAQVAAMADSAVAKNAELGITSAQAMTAIFTENPAAYDEYEAEQRMR